MDLLLWDILCVSKNTASGTLLGTQPSCIETAHCSHQARQVKTTQVLAYVRSSQRHARRGRVRLIGARLLFVRFGIHSTRRLQQVPQSHQTAWIACSAATGGRHPGHGARTSWHGTSWRRGEASGEERGRSWGHGGCMPRAHQACAVFQRGPLWRSAQQLPQQQQIAAQEEQQQ